MFDDIIKKEWKCDGRSGTPGCAGRPKQEKNGSMGDTRYYDYWVWDSCKGNKHECPYDIGDNNV